MDTAFSQDVLKGLTSYPKYLSSKYFYDAKGDKLFQQIMHLPEYYLTRCEFEILKKYRQELLEYFSASAPDGFDLIELGAGDGTKTKLLLQHFVEEATVFKYHPVDISQTVLDELTGSLKKEIPMLQVDAIPKEYFEAIKSINNSNGTKKKVVLFLGSNIGNFGGDSVHPFLKQLSDALASGDMVLTGMDLKKDPHIIHQAYDDKEGVTRAFNINLLDRINRELHGDFNKENFMHYAVYDPQTGMAQSYLVSTKDQQVKILDKLIQFTAWETIHMEISQKFDMDMIKSMADRAGFKIIGNFFDDQNYFVNSLWRKN